MQYFNCFVIVSSSYITNTNVFSSCCLGIIFNNDKLKNIVINTILLDYQKDTVTFTMSFNRIEDRDNFIKTISFILNEIECEYSYGVGELNYA